MIIAISGLSGCGNTSVSKLLSQKLNLKLINYTFRNLAKDKGMDFEEIIRQSKLTYDLDLELDKKIVEFANEGNCIVGSRLAIWIIKNADLKVYLNASVDTRIKRIAGREDKDFEKAKEETVSRDERDTKRYQHLYKIDNTKPEGVCDIQIDTDNKTVEEIVEIILNAVKNK